MCYGEKLENPKALDSLLLRLFVVGKPHHHGKLDKKPANRENLPTSLPDHRYTTCLIGGIGLFMRVRFLNPTETQKTLLMTNAALSVVACTLVRVHVGKTGTAAAARAFEHELPASH